MNIKTEIHEPDAETKWFDPILDDLRAAFPGVNFTLVASGLCWGKPVIQIEWNGNDAPGDAVVAALSKYQGVIDLIFAYTPSFKEVARIQSLISQHPEIMDMSMLDQPPDDDAGAPPGAGANVDGIRRRRSKSATG